jgi:hypothetical protein
MMIAAADMMRKNTPKLKKRSKSGVKTWRKPENGAE